jgi:hypothetical protein
MFVWVLVFYLTFVCYFPCVVIDVVFVLLWLTGSFQNSVCEMLCVVTMGKGLLNATDVALLMYSYIIAAWLVDFFFLQDCAMYCMLSHALISLC